jgi:hypothetical protein
MIDWSILVAWAIGAGSGRRPFSATATDGRRIVSIPYKTRREAEAMAPALARALAQANR